MQSQSSGLRASTEVSWSCKGEQALQNSEKRMDIMWSKGEINSYKYEVKHYGEGSHYGIDEGKISKLAIYKDGKWVYNYDRGLDFDKLDEAGKAAYTAILKQYN